MQNYYEVNVTLNGRHLFATSPRSVQTEEELEKVSEIFKEKFPSEEGFEVTVQYWRTVGTEIK